MKKVIKIWVILIPVIFLLVWGVALIKCELLTLLHGDEFKNNYQENTMIDEIDYLKVLQYSENTAKIYYVTENKSTGEVLMFKNINNEWVYDQWYGTIWSGIGGSASGVVWPYLWHFIHGGI